MAATVLENPFNSKKRHTSPVISRMKKEEVYKSRRNSQKGRYLEQLTAYLYNFSALLPCDIGIGELNKVSEALGLRRNFLDEVKSIPDDILYHKGLKGFVAIFIENAYFDIEEESLKEKLSEELLKQVGFTDSEVINTIMTRSEKMEQHLDPIDFIKRFVKDEFKYNPNLIEYTTPEKEAIPDDADVFHFADYRNDEQNEHCEVIRLFHGTDLYSAIDIMKNGIEIDFGRHKHDFSDGGGFYLTSLFKHAETWARSQTRRPVVFELKIQKTCLEKARTLNLDVSMKEGRLEWDRLVSEHRSGRPSKKLRQEMKAYDCIEGPISVPSQDPDSGKIRFKPEPDSYQLCVVKRRFAKEIENNAKYTLYTDP